MADISMCNDMKCPMKYDCYRHTAPFNPWRQAMFVESPREEGKYYCDKFWDNSGYTLDKKFREYEKPVVSLPKEEKE
jgi:hypothetical protein